MQLNKKSILLFGFVVTIVATIAFVLTSQPSSSIAEEKMANSVAPVAEQTTTDAAKDALAVVEKAKEAAIEAAEETIATDEKAAPAKKQDLVLEAIEISKEIKEQTGTETSPNGLNLITATTERTMGDAKAPITVIEYASMTCSHCAAFHNASFNKIKKTYIETGKVYWILREFPLDKLALKASQAARCTQPSMYFNFVEVLFSSQDRWAHSDDPLGALEKTASLAGVNADLFNECINNRDLETHVLKNMQTGQKQWEVKSTPTFIINYGEERMSGTRTFEDFQEIFDKLLQKAGVQ